MMRFNKKIKKKKICFVLGSRANYSSIKTVMTEFQKNLNFNIQIILFNSSILDRYGDISELLKNDKFLIKDKIFTLVEGEKPLTMAKSTGLGLIEISTCLDRISPDLVFVVGDRFETMATAISSTYMNIPLAHTMGGEVTGTIDESIRHALTKLSHLHFVATKNSKIRVKKMGENPSNIFQVGCPRIDFVKETLELTKLNKDDIKDGVGYQIDYEKPFIIFSYHPVTTEYVDIKNQIDLLLSCINDLDIQSIIIWPNADAGSGEIAKMIRIYRERGGLKKTKLFKNIPTQTYIHLLNKTKCIVGNSSSGIREGNYIGVPCVNIGSRQNLRERGKNVLDVGYDKKKIINAIKTQIKIGKYSRDFLYGDGKAGKKIVNILEKIKNIKVQKTINY